MPNANGDDGQLPVVEPGDLDGRKSVRQRAVAGVVLAAGAGRRFGPENKLLAPLDGRPVVDHAVRAVERASLTPLVVVVGHEADRLKGALGDRDVEIVHNPDYASGQATSVARGIEAVHDRADGVLIALGDMPAVTVGTIRTLVHAYRVGAGDALAAAHEGRRGNPVLFDERYFSDLTDVNGDVGGRSVLLNGDRSAFVETGDPCVHRDVDTPDDLDAIATGRYRH